MTVNAQTGQPFPRGARRSPVHKVLQAPEHFVIEAPPPQFAVVPPKLDMWGNDQYGDCVSAEEAFAKAAWSAGYCGLSETFATAQEVESFASRYGYLNGADLTSVMDTMKASGMSIGGTVYKDGGYSSVNYADETALQSALTVGPVKIAIDANALPSGAGNQMGWHATGGSPGQYPNTDHCVAVAGYGTATYLFGLLGVPVPSGFGSGIYYFVYTWKTIGVVDHAWLMSTTTEAWVRSPTTPGQAPTPTPTPGPSPTPNPTPLPSSGNLQLSLNYTLPHTISAGTITINPTAPPVPKELTGLGAPIWVLILVQILGSKVIPTILADLQAGKSWTQIGEDLLAILLAQKQGVAA